MSSDSLIRFVVGPGEEIVPDIEASLPGRGLWVAASTEALEQAVQKSAFSKAARRKVRTPVDLATLVQTRLVERCQSLLGLARRAGTLTVGFENVRGLAVAGKVAVIVHAADAATHGVAKLDGVSSTASRVTVLTREELSLAVGRENVVHAALAQGRLANHFVVDAARLAGLRGKELPSKVLPTAKTDEGKLRSRIKNAGP